MPADSERTFQVHLEGGEFEDPVPFEKGVEIRRFCPDLIKRGSVLARGEMMAIFTQPPSSRNNQGERIECLSAKY